MSIRHSTAESPGYARGRYWEQVIALTYFPLKLDIPLPERFNASLAVDSLGSLSLSRHQSSAIRYARDRRHLIKERDEQFLVTVPETGEIDFSQGGHDVHCTPSGFILQRSHEPYEFSHRGDNSLLVLKVPAPVLRAHIREPDRFCALGFDASKGVGALFVDFLRLVPSRLTELNEDGRAAIGQQLVDLLALAIEADDRALKSNQSCVRTAHLRRIESYIRRQLHDPDLNPQAIADACGISVRYLHQLFHRSEQTVTQWIREQRLHACNEALRNPANHQTIADIAYRWGFSDQAQFSRAYKAQFGISPREARVLGRLR